MMQSNDRYKKVRQAQSLRQGDGTSPTGVGGGVVGAGRNPISANVPMPVASARPSAMDQVMEGAKTAKSAYDLYGDISGATAGAASAGSGMFGAGSTGGSALAGTADAYGTTQAANTGMNLGGGLVVALLLERLGQVQALLLEVAAVLQVELALLLELLLALQAHLLEAVLHLHLARA